MYFFLSYFDGCIHFCVRKVALCMSRMKKQKKWRNKWFYWYILFTWNMMLLLTAFPLHLSMVQDKKKKGAVWGKKALFLTSLASDCVCRLEQDEKEESVQALRNLVLLVGSLTTCGFTELRPTTSNSDSLFHLPGFVVPQPMGKGSDSSLVCSLTQISSVWFTVAV